METEELGEKCDHDPCHCVTNSDNAVFDGKVVYCSKGCAAGIGCKHEECSCVDAD